MNLTCTKKNNPSKQKIDATLIDSKSNGVIKDHSGDYSEL